MSEYTTIKIKKKVAIRLLRLAGKLSLMWGRRVTYNDVIEYLLNKLEQPLEIDEATKKLIELLENPQLEGGPEDLREYDFEDIGG